MIAIVLNDKDVIKVTNLKRKLKKIQNNPLMTILEECEDSESDDRLKYWKSVYKYEKEEIIEEKGCYPKILYYEISGLGQFPADNLGTNPIFKTLTGKHHIKVVYDIPKYNREYERDFTRSNK